MHPGIEAVSQWLIDGARSACRPEDVLATLCTRLLTCGIPGLLAIFPVKNSVADVCAGALAAAQEASAAVAAMAADPKAALCGVRFGLALHLGEVAYGNVGSERLLDFTCIGAAVNLVARLEKLAGELGRTIVASSAFACQCASPLLRLGEFAFAGFSRRETVFAVPQTPEAGSIGRSLLELAQRGLSDR